MDNSTEENLPQAAGSVESNRLVQISARKSLITAAVCAVLCVIFINIGFFQLIYLAPLGVAVLVCKSVLMPFFITAGINAAFCLITRSSPGAWIEIFYFSVMFLCFSWVIGGGNPLANFLPVKNIRTAWRFIAASAICASIFIFFITGPMKEVFEEVVKSAASFMSLLTASSSGDDAVRSSAVQQSLAPENVLHIVRTVLFRGGVIFSMFFMFFINRHLSRGFVYRFTASNKMYSEEQKSGGLVSFFVSKDTIWVLSGSLATILIFNHFNVEIIEIAAWNVFVVCGILFLAQGAGIALYFLARKTRGFRFLANILFVIVILSPLNTAAVAALILLGIAETWIKIRLNEKLVIRS